MSGRRLGSGLVGTGQVVSILALALAGGLMVWGALPLLLGWSTHAVVSGSMSPQVQVGDVLVSGEVAPSELRPGMVVLFRDPVDPERVISHRIAAVNEDGSFTTQGDANPTADTAAVPAGNVLGVARLRVPWIGYPAVWLGEARYDLVAGTLASVIGMTLLALWPDRRPGDDGGAPGPAAAEPWPWLVHMRTP
ncbi:signal peptidase I [Kineosporia rhizophila]|uniref:signal peptidase I n=1 Tax=Kineosporia TaxID=49184 RepID=UPI001E4698C6|nr:MULTISPECIES: signal peptidase I [Kineosporia]MCE0538684.1 signal peptidase I [Kineosporia rhizophila]GLY19462.1 hypothetical protein Kisp01_64760 [Kineosporia sp. NBRC 101677]